MEKETDPTPIETIISRCINKIYLDKDNPSLIVFELTGGKKLIVNDLYLYDKHGNHFDIQNLTYKNAS